MAPMPRPLYCVMTTSMARYPLNSSPCGSSLHTTVAKHLSSSKASQHSSGQFCRKNLWNTVRLSVQSKGTWHADMRWLCHSLTRLC